MTQTQAFISEIVRNVERVIIGKRDSIELLLVALLCEGHVLIEDVPGVGKTMLARSIAISIGGQFKRLRALMEDFALEFMNLAERNFT